MAIAQLPYFNEWIQSDKYYVKLKVAENGLYRVTRSDLANHGANDLDAVVSGNMQLYYRGEEVPLYIHDSLSGAFDYLEFYGYRNDGAIDSLMYRRNSPPFIHDGSRQPSAYTSFFTDTSAYFLTWDGVGSRRLSAIHPTGYGTYSPEPYYRYKIFQHYLDEYFYGGGGATDWENRLNPDWITGEGMVSKQLEPTTFEDILSRKLYTWGVANTGNPVRVEARVFGVNNSPEHVVSLEVVSESLKEAYRDTFYGIEFEELAFDYHLPIGDSSFIRFHAEGQGSPTDYQRVGWATFAYDRVFDLHGDSATVLSDWNRSDTTYLRFYGAAVDNAAWVYDITRDERIQGTVSGDTLRFLVPGHPQSRDLHVFTDRAVKVPVIDAAPRFAGIADDSLGAEFVIITHPKFAHSAGRYAAYRDSNSVNRLRTKVVFVDEIFNEFGYGSYTPVAIKNFCRYTLEQWSTRPQHFMIWGKGRTCPRCPGETENYVPVWGNPANDLEFVSNMRLDTMDLVPLAGMGRVSLMVDEQGLSYLEKVDQYEHAGLEVWNKEVLFMGGGADGTQQNAIRFYITNKDLTGYSDLWEAPPLNGKGWKFQKRNNGFEANDPLTTESRINKGVVLLQYFGHGSTNVFELDVLEPNRYRNYGKYPMMFSFGCSGGDYTVMPATYGERFILEPGKGGIGFLGNTTTGDLQTLAQFGQLLYASILDSAYGKSFGEVMRKGIEGFVGFISPQQYITAANHAKQMNFQGDPSIAMHLPTKCDIRVGEEDLYFPDGMPGALDAQYRLNLILHNDGRSFEDSFQVYIRHQLPGLAGIVYSDTVKRGPFARADTVELTILNPAGIASVGYNHFTVSVDPVDRIDEYTNANNSFELDQLFVGKVANPVIPQEFAIVSDATIALVASSYQMLPTGPLKYLFEIDSSATFNSPFKKSSPVVIGNSASGEWPIPFAMTPGQVYYWRSRLADVYPERWLSSSFKYVPGRTGWSQGTIHQLSKNLMEGVVLDTANREWHFDHWTAPLHAYIQASGKAVYFLGSYGSENDRPSGVYYTIIDQHTLAPRFQGLNTGDWQFVAVSPPYDGNGLRVMAQDVRMMAEGDHFLMVSNVDPIVPTWPDDVLHALELVGANYGQLSQMDSAQRIILMGRKGMVSGSAIQIDQPNLPVTNGPAIHDLQRNLSARVDAGTLRSGVIGPASNWSEVAMQWTSIDLNAADSSALAIYGIRRDGSEALIQQDESVPLRSLRAINADSFPWIRLENLLSDAKQRTPPQLSQWEVYHEPVADLAIDADLGLIMPDTIVEGELIRVRLHVRNLTSRPIDSVDVRFTLRSADRTEIAMGSTRMSNFLARDVHSVSYLMQTAGKGLTAGTWTLIAEVNPEKAQPECHYFNNLYYHPVKLLVDEIGPLVDVTVDGKHLMSGDIVSPTPEMVIQVNDENDYLPVAVSDSTYRIWFGTERSYWLNPMVRIEDNDSVEQQPVRMPENKSRLTFRPGRLVDGEYTLAVQAFDAKGNTATGKPYSIQMNVVNKQSISEVLPYPNPFSSACHFVFTLTGEEMPTRFDVEIYTITGKLVKVIDLLGMGQVRTGYNITDYAWDGRDEFGDLLANGVYLYRVNARFNATSGVEHRDEGISQYFRNGYGKMYLMR